LTVAQITYQILLPTLQMRILFLFGNLGVRFVSKMIDFFCITPIFITNSGIVGFGAQILGMRVGLGLGLNYDRIVVGNPGHEASMVQSELKWRSVLRFLYSCVGYIAFLNHECQETQLPAIRFGHSGKLTSPWGPGALLE
jgi:hypothetical protein